MHGLSPSVHLKFHLPPFLFSSGRGFPFSSRRNTREDFAQVPLQTRFTVTHTHKCSHPGRHRGSGFFLNSLCKSIVHGTECSNAVFLIPHYAHSSVGPDMLCLLPYFHWKRVISVWVIPYTQSSVIMCICQPHLSKLGLCGYELECVCVCQM